jgi:hypothetical protein
MDSNVKALYISILKRGMEVIEVEQRGEYFIVRLGVSEAAKSEYFRAGMSYGVHSAYILNSQAGAPDECISTDRVTKNTHRT